MFEGATSFNGDISGWKLYESLTNLFKNIDFKTKNKNINRLSIKDSRNLYLSFGEQNLFRNAKNVYKDFKLINNSDLDQILNHSLNLNNHPNLSNVMFLTTANSYN